MDNIENLENDVKFINDSNATNYVCITPTDSVSGGYATKNFLGSGSYAILDDGSKSIQLNSYKNSLTVSGMTYYDVRCNYDSTSMTSGNMFVKGVWHSNIATYKSTITGKGYHYIFSENDNNIASGNTAIIQADYIGANGTSFVHSVFDSSNKMNRVCTSCTNLSQYVTHCIWGRIYTTQADFNIQLEYQGIKTDSLHFTRTAEGYSTITSLYFPVLKAGETMTLYITNNSTSKYYITVGQAPAEPQINHEVLAGGATGSYTLTSTGGGEYYRVSIAPHYSIGGAKVFLKDQSNGWELNAQNFTTAESLGISFYDVSGNLQTYKTELAKASDGNYFIRDYFDSGHYFVNLSKPRIALSFQARNESDSTWSSMHTGYKLNKPFALWSDLSWLTTGTRINVTGIFASSHQNVPYCFVFAGHGFTGTIPNFEGYDFTNGNTTYNDANGDATMVVVNYTFYRKDNNGTVKIFNTEMPYNSDNRYYSIPVVPNTPYLITPPDASATANVYTVQVYKNTSTTVKKIDIAPTVEQSLTIRDFKQSESPVCITVTGKLVPKCYIRVNGTWKTGITYIYYGDLDAWGAASPYISDGTTWHEAETL